MTVPGPGELELAKTRKVKGRAKVKAKITYTPDGGAANPKTKSVKLVKR